METPDYDALEEQYSQSGDLFVADLKGRYMDGNWRFEFTG
jgi:hypothetical protein